MIHDKTSVATTENGSLSPAPPVTLSIITVTFNAGQVLEKTLASIFEQSFKDYELVIIDGKSTDDTLDIINRHSDRITFFASEPDDGIYDAMNKGLSAARGEYVQFLIARDYYCDNQVLADMFSDMSDELTVIYGDIHILATDGKTSYQKAGEFEVDELLKRGTGVVCHQAVFARRTKAPRYDCRYRYKAELNWYFDIAESGNFKYRHVSRPVVYYSLGGYGYKNFVRNRLEWVWLIYRRYGIRTVYRSRIIIFLIKNSFNRYPLLYNPKALIRRMSSFRKKA